MRLFLHLASAINHLFKDPDAFGQQSRHWIVATPLQRPLLLCITFIVSFNSFITGAELLLTAITDALHHLCQFLIFIQIENLSGEDSGGLHILTELDKPSVMPSLSLEVPFQLLYGVPTSFSNHKSKFFAKTSRLHNFFQTLYLPSYYECKYIIELFIHNITIVCVLYIYIFKIIGILIYIYKYIYFSKIR